jgi:proton-translocating NADH-quinone oxidoreductase chain N
MILELG